MTIEQALFRLHEGLPRNCPGSESSTIKALRRLGRLPRHPRVIDLGCGNGASAIPLARRLKADVVAVDAHEPFLRRLESRLAEEPLTDGNVTVHHADFSTLESDLGTFDLLWSEGAAYVLGLEEALTKWRPLLKRRGRAAITELSWTVDHPSQEAKDYWSSVYPGMRTVVGNCAAAERAGYTVVDTMTLPNKDWMAYYNPMKQRIAELRAEGEPSPELAVVVDEAEREISIYERHGDEFGYVFYLLEVPSDGSEDEAAAEEAAQDGEFESVYSDRTIDSTLIEESSLSSRRGPRSSRSRLMFDEGIAPVDVAAHRSAELRFTDLVAEIGLERATALLEEIRTRMIETIESSR
jgi:serine/threonine-protein kinase HipA